MRQAMVSLCEKQMRYRRGGSMHLPGAIMRRFEGPPANESPSPGKSQDTILSPKLSSVAPMPLVTPVDQPAPTPHEHAATQPTPDAAISSGVGAGSNDATVELKAASDESGHNPVVVGDGELPLDDTIRSVSRHEKAHRRGGIAHYYEFDTRSRADVKSVHDLVRCVRLVGLDVPISEEDIRRASDSPFCCNRRACFIWTTMTSSGTIASGRTISRSRT